MFNNLNKKNGAIGIIGLGRFGMALAQRLCELGKEVLAVDESEAKIKEIRNYTEYAFVVDNFTKETLQEAGIQNCEVVVVCISEKIDVSILTTLNVVSLGVPKVIAKSVSYEQGCVLEKLGAEVVYPERDMALRVAKRIVAANVLDYLSLNGGIEISEIKILDKWVNKSIGQLDIRKQYNLNIIAIEQGNNIVTEISPQYKFSKDDIIIVIGKKESIEEFENH
ncbi:TrkA family potassium uptake protein [Cellulosilyticum sp. ST5]|uniref:TrkA-N domain protein n=1 Tax=Cellulosilyticum lentocellum (strain ATCC 49066 / DSM 5427 / NCIMB 11756 / RHM5) TaxID=642492 RepID=F2JIW1_CELLD|nr:MULTISPECIES: TrkA family potassium uptake protein [Cellulosilyticum]ADZ82033.1 TrkA-N domain protein [Cellulosilyticum lentocellum DSM 5427]QEH67751.1 TrkA family potassium uptake protein [Cellulosilyticum sp. WCF-2]